MAKELKLMKGNQAIAEAAIRCGCDGYFGYPITPQSEVLEHLMAERPYLTTGMVVLQAESELASINMVYAGAAAGKRVMTSSSSPGFSLMQEGLSYIAGAELPALCVNVVRGGPGLGTIQPSQSDYFQTTKGGGHGDYRLITLAPASVQEMYDFVELGFDLAFKYRNPVAILSDGVIGQVMEKSWLTTTNLVGPTNISNKTVRGLQRVTVPLANTESLLLLNLKPSSKKQSTTESKLNTENAKKKTLVTKLSTATTPNICS